MVSRFSASAKKNVIIVLRRLGIILVGETRRPFIYMREGEFPTNIY